MSGLLLVVGKLRQLHKALVGWGGGVVKNVMWRYVKYTQLFPRFHSQKPRTNLPSSIQIPIALSFADIPCGVSSLHCFAIIGPVIAIRMPQHVPTPFDSTCSSGILTLQPPALSLLLISFTGPLQPFPPRTLPKLCACNPGFPNKTTVCRSLVLAVIPGDVGLFEVPQAGYDEDYEDDEGSSINGVVEKKSIGRSLPFLLLGWCWSVGRVLLSFCVMKLWG